MDINFFSFSASLGLVAGDLQEVHRHGANHPTGQLPGAWCGHGDARKALNSKNSMSIQLATLKLSHVDVSVYTYSKCI